MEGIPQTTFLSLPTELRLQIATYALEQPAYVGLIPSWSSGRVDATYSSADSLSVLLVCRQFHHEFANLAFQMTRFILNSHTMQAMHRLSVAKQKNLRKLVIPGACLSGELWHSYPFNNDDLRLDELCIITSDGYNTVPNLLRRLQHVKKLRILPCREGGHYYDTYSRLLGAIYKEDHYQRYDAPGAPNIGSTWFEACLNVEDMSFDFVARKPEPVLAEEDYMVMMKPKIDTLMEDWLANVSLRGPV